MLYIRVKDTNIVKGFSDAFETPVEGDICIDESDTRHFHIGDEINPSLCTMDGLYLYWYIDGEIIKKTDEEIKEETPAPVIVPDSLHIQIDSLIASMDFILLEFMPPV